jgi:hypothetical protein
MLIDRRESGDEREGKNETDLMIWKATEFGFLTCFYDWCSELCQGLGFGGKFEHVFGSQRLL